MNTDNLKRKCISSASDMEIRNKKKSGGGGGICVVNVLSVVGVGAYLDISSPNSIHLVLKVHITQVDLFLIYSTYHRPSPHLTPGASSPLLQALPSLR